MVESRTMRLSTGLPGLGSTTGTPLTAGWGGALPALPEPPTPPHPRGSFDVPSPPAFASMPWHITRLGFRGRGRSCSSQPYS